MKTWAMEVFRAVEDDSGNFNDCADHEFSRRELLSFIRDELEEAGIPERQLAYYARRFTWTQKPSFIEFDSSNPSHACGYWDFEISGPDEIVAKLEAHYADDAEAETKVKAALGKRA